MLGEYLSIPELSPKLAVALFLCRLFSRSCCEEPTAIAYLPLDMTNIALSVPSPCLLVLKPRSHYPGSTLGWVGRTSIPQCWDDVLFLFSIFGGVHFSICFLIKQHEIS